MSGPSEPVHLETPEREAARRAREGQAALAARGTDLHAGFDAGFRSPRPIPPPPIHDPLPFCVYTTVALLAWALSPALVAAVFGALGLRAYHRAWRAGLRKSDCILGDPRLVMLYLGAAAAGGLAWTVWRALVWLR